MEHRLRAGLDLTFYGLLHETETEIARQNNPDYTASRGEYLNGLLLADYLGWRFIDAARTW